LAMASNPKRALSLLMLVKILSLVWSNPSIT
jgi:hypothetical protein